MLPDFHLGPIPIRPYGLMLLLAFGCALWLAARLARQRGLDSELFWDAAVPVLVSSIVSARLMYVLLELKTFLADPVDILRIWSGGLSVHGGVIGGILAGWVFTHRRKVPFLPYVDVAAPAIALGQVIGRIGCLLKGCCHGGPTTLPWGLSFYAGDPTRYHPAQLYESAGSLLLMGLLIWRLRRPHTPGQILAAYAGGYSLVRFATEYFRRGITGQLSAFGLTEAQIASVAIAAVAVTVYVWLGRRSPADAPSEVEAPAAAE